MEKLIKLSDVEKIIKKEMLTNSYWHDNTLYIDSAEILISLGSLPTIDPLEFTQYDYRWPWASEEAKECIREQHNNKIKIHYHWMKDIYSSNN